MGKNREYTVSFGTEKSKFKFREQNLVIFTDTFVPMKMKALKKNSTSICNWKIIDQLKKLKFKEKKCVRKPLWEHGGDTSQWSKSEFISQQEA